MFQTSGEDVTALGLNERLCHSDPCQHFLTDWLPETQQHLGYFFFLLLSLFSSLFLFFPLFFLKLFFSFSFFSLSLFSLFSMNFSPLYFSFFSFSVFSIFLFIYFFFLFSFLVLFFVFFFHQSSLLFYFGRLMTL